MEDLTVSARLVIPARELRVTYARSGGPGGQNVNKVETKADLRWTPAESDVLSESDRAWLLKRLATRLTNEGELVVVSSQTRERARNVEGARQRLAKIVRDALVRPKLRRKTRPSRGSIERRIERKKSRGAVKKSRRWRPRDD